MLIVQSWRVIDHSPTNTLGKSAFARYAECTSQSSGDEMTTTKSRRKFSVSFSVLTFLSALLIGVGLPISAQADFSPFTLISPTNNQQVKLGSTNNWYLPIRVQGAGPGSDGNRFTAYFYDTTGDVAASVSWDITPQSRIDTPVDWTFKLGISNLKYVENPISAAIYVRRDAKYLAHLSATKAPFKTGTLKPGTYSLQLFVTNLTNNGQPTPIGDISGLTIGAPTGVKCAPGSYSKTGTWTSRTPCTLAAPGYVVSAAGSKKQVATPAGSYTPSSGAAYNFKCREGSFQGSAGKASCSLASRGYFVSNSGATKQVKCAVGKYADQTGSFNCNIASPGTYVPAEGGVAALQCALGRYQPLSGKGFCTPAPTGSFVGIRGATWAVLCEPGFYQNLTGASSCKQATRGHFAYGSPNTLGFGATDQAECFYGTFSSNAGAFECAYAPLGYYVATIGASVATQCPVGTTTQILGAYRLEDCVPND